MKCPFKTPFKFNLRFKKAEPLPALEIICPFCHKDILAESDKKSKSL